MPSSISLGRTKPGVCSRKIPLAPRILLAVGIAVGQINTVEVCRKFIMLIGLEQNGGRVR